MVRKRVMSNVVKFRDPFDLDAAAAASAESALFCNDPSLADQSGADDADINVILRRFGVTGQLPTPRRLPQWGVDFSDVVTDYQTAQNQLIQAQQLFMELPADLRKRFDNDPGQFLKLVDDAGTDDKAKALLKEFGLLAPEVVPTPPQEVIVRGGKLDPLESPPGDSGGK